MLSKQELPQIIIADTEVFSKYFLCVAKDFQTNEVFVVESRKAMRELYEKYKHHVWCTYNTSYDKYIIRAALCNINPKLINDAIIYGTEPIWRNLYVKNMGNKFPLVTYDIKTTDKSLKVLEAFMGEDIKETTVPFDLERHLTRQEKDEVIKYCRHDVEMAAKVFSLNFDKFLIHWHLVNKFMLPLSCLDKTASRLSLSILECKKPAVRFDQRKNKYYEVICSYNDQFDIREPNGLMLLKYNNVSRWFWEQCCKGKSGENVYNNSLEVAVAGCPCAFGWGGCHGALKQFSAKGLIVCLDVNLMHPSLMIYNRYYSRNLRYPNRYVDMYLDRLKLQETHPELNKAYKLQLNSVSGTFKDKYSKAYDPLMSNNICVGGQLLILDLMEKIEINTSCTLLQCNTDGVFYLVNSEEDYHRLQSVAAEWMNRTRLQLKEETYNRIYQRDVNTYLLIASDGRVKAKGAIKNKNLLDNDLPIIGEAIQNYFLNGTPVEDYINNCNDFIKFQKVYSLKGQYNFAVHNGKRLNGLKVYRVFASKNPEDTALFKGCDHFNGEIEVFAGCPRSCFIENNQVIGKPVPDNLDKDWYIKEAKRKLESWENKTSPVLSSLL